jgi:molecular chaperone GrpE (heat shock protein)
MSDHLWRDQPDLAEVPAEEASAEAPPVAIDEPLATIAEPPAPGEVQTAAIEPEPEGAADVEPLPETEPEPEPEPDMGLLGAISDRVAAMAGSVAELAALEQRHADLIERLHADNTRLRDGELVTALKPLFLDLARLYDDVDDMVERGGEAFARVGIVRDLVADLLERHGVTRLAPDAGSPFESGKHTAVGVVATEDASLNGLVASVRRIGFLRDGVHVVRPAQVYVNRSTPGVTPADAAQTADDPGTEMEQQ